MYDRISDGSARSSDARVVGGRSAKSLSLKSLRSSMSSVNADLLLIDQRSFLIRESDCSKSLSLTVVDFQGYKNDSMILKDAKVSVRGWRVKFQLLATFVYIRHQY